ncbi:hypothetical protein MAE02_70940 [Microvirga aerophila]|uniref:Uncharacterized protein n=1 Tax=Microvirga aerophila TaxID=670291 RepID=A0A512C5A8_9HYPH|nr:hypothetical protein MAE02_70940 [Microvirga aerophila]
MVAASGRITDANFYKPISRKVVCGTHGDYGLLRVVRLEGCSPCAHVFFAGQTSLTGTIVWL